MRRLITLLAAATLTITPFAFAADQKAGNPNDVLQQIPTHQTDTNEGITVADSGKAAEPISANDNAAVTPVKKKHHAKHHHVKKHHAKKHHVCKKNCKPKPKKTASTNETDTTAVPEQTS